MFDQRTTDQSTFMNWTSIAGDIFSYIENNTEIREYPWGFDSGLLASNQERVSANFSCISACGYSRDKLHVTATHLEDGALVITHNLQKA